MSIPTTFECLCAGSIAGSMSILVCHPMDVVRTQVQASTQNATAVIRHLLNDPNPFNSFYRGVWGPFCAQAVYKSVIFSSNMLVNQHLFHGHQSTISIFFSGLIAGSANAAIVAPIEIIRTQQIMSRASASACVKTLVRDYGLKGLWRSLVPSMIRDGPGIGLYMLIFSRSKIIISECIPNHDIVTRLVSGAMSGIGFWMWALPVDTIKTIIESNSLSISSHSNKSRSMSVFYRTTLDILNKEEGGLLRLYKAWPVALGRGIPAAAVTLTTYDVVQTYLINHR